MDNLHETLVDLQEQKIIAKEQHSECETHYKQLCDRIDKETARIIKLIRAGENPIDNTYMLNEN